MATYSDSTLYIQENSHSMIKLGGNSFCNKPSAVQLPYRWEHGACHMASLFGHLFLFSDVAIQLFFISFIYTEEVS